jgi:hypothetical protein
VARPSGRAVVRCSRTACRRNCQRVSTTKDSSRPAGISTDQRGSSENTASEPTDISASVSVDITRRRRIAASRRARTCAADRVGTGAITRGTSLPFGRTTYRARSLSSVRRDSTRIADEYRSTAFSRLRSSCRRSHIGTR